MPLPLNAIRASFSELCRYRRGAAPARPRWPPGRAGGHRSRSSPPGRGDRWPARPRPGWAHYFEELLRGVAFLERETRFPARIPLEPVYSVFGYLMVVVDQQLPVAGLDPGR